MFFGGIAGAFWEEDSELEAIFSQFRRKLPWTASEKEVVVTGRKVGKYSFLFSRLKAAALLVTATAVLQFAGSIGQLPKLISVRSGQDYQLACALPVELEWDGETPVSTNAVVQTQGTLKLFGIVPVKEVSIHVLPDMELIPGGFLVSVKLFCDGVLVVGLGDVQTQMGNVSPARKAGLAVSDVVVSIDNVAVDTIEALREAVQQGNGQPVTVTFLRQGKEQTVTVTPALSTSGGYSMGLWVRDSTAGVGTVSFIEPESGVFGSLGHPVCDVDTGNMLPVKSGYVQRSEVISSQKGVRGTPGALYGVFDKGKEDGVILANTNAGLFGSFSQVVWDEQQAVPIATSTEIKTGDATILCCVDGSEVAEYTVRIVRINDDLSAQSRNLLLKVTDQRLLDATGGIVQGMSGSPILQNGKLVGAVTHVLVDDPTQGYGIFIENMICAIPEQNVTQQPAA